jgi:hypothetical protein
VSLLQTMDTLVMQSIDLTVGFAIPNYAAIQAIRECGKIVQMGAGTGYWAGLLQQAGVDIVTYDLHPPGTIVLARRKMSFLSGLILTRTSSKGLVWMCLNTTRNSPRSIPS